MKIYSGSFRLLSILSLTVSLAAIAGESGISRQVGGYASYFSQSMAPMSVAVATPHYPKVIVGVDSAQKMWQCLQNPSSCSSQEVTKARAWIRGTRTQSIAALMARAGVAVTRHQIYQAKKELRRLDLR